MKSKAILFLSLLLLPACFSALAAPAVHYLLSPPDGGEDTFWTWPNHDDSAWHTAPNLAAVGAAVRAARADQAWVRIEIEQMPETLNNVYFRIRHSGPMEIYVNGLKRANSTEAVAGPATYLVSPRRPESPGKNVYAIHFRNDGTVAPQLDIEFLDAPWSSPDDGTLRPAPVLPDMIRDAQVCPGPSGTYYLTGTMGDTAFLKPGPNAWLRNPGIQVFKSTNLRDWESLGWVWTFERDGSWNRDFGTFGGHGPARAIFAPKIYYVNGAFWMVYAVNDTTTRHSFGIGLLHANKPEGPWHEMSPDKPITAGFDPSLFEDDDGTVYLLKQAGEIAPLKRDMTGLSESFHALIPANYPDVGYEGTSLFKRAGCYYLDGADWNVHADGSQSYDCMLATATNIYGPYGPRYDALRFGGHNSWFQDKQGNWNATVWCYPDHDPHWQKVSIVRMNFSEDGRFHVTKP